MRILEEGADQAGEGGGEEAAARNGEGGGGGGGEGGAADADQPDEWDSAGGGIDHRNGGDGEGGVVDGPGDGEGGGGAEAGMEDAGIGSATPVLEACDEIAPQFPDISREILEDVWRSSGQNADKTRRILVEMCAGLGPIP